MSTLNKEEAECLKILLSDLSPVVKATRTKCNDLTVEELVTAVMELKSQSAVIAHYNLAPGSNSTIVTGEIQLHTDWPIKQNNVVGSGRQSSRVSASRKLIKIAREIETTQKVVSPGNISKIEKLQSLAENEPKVPTSLPEARVEPPVALCDFALIDQLLSTPIARQYATHLLQQR